MEKARTVLVTDADRGSAVVIIRSLGRQGYRVIAADSTPRSVGFHSRYALEKLVYPDPATEPDHFVELLHRAVVERGVDLVIPVTDEVIHPLVRSRERFEAVCRLAIPETAALERVTDKSKTLALAQALGVPVPHTRVVRTIEEARQAAKEMAWPLVLKPAVSRLYIPERGIVEKFSVSYADSVDSLAERMAPLAGRQSVLLQEYCPGVGEGVELLAFEGRPIAAFQHRRLAEVPLTGGVSAWRESVPLHPEMVAHSSRIVKALRWTGLIMVEFKVGDQIRLMEVNGRIWGSLPLAVLSGMDFPAKLAALYLNGPPQEMPAAPDALVSDYRLGVRAFNLGLTLNWIVRVLTRRSAFPFLPLPQRRRVFAALAGLLSPRQKLDLSSLDDPKPAIRELLKIVRKSTGKAMSAGRTDGEQGDGEHRG